MCLTKYTFTAGSNKIVIESDSMELAEDCARDIIGGVDSVVLRASEPVYPTTRVVEQSGWYPDCASNYAAA